MATPMTPSVLTLIDIARSKSRGFFFSKTLYLIKCYYCVTTNHQQETIYGECNDAIIFDLE